MALIPELEQNSIEWELHRANGIGASEMPILMRDSPYRTPYWLFQVKTGIRIDDTDPEVFYVDGERVSATEHGHKLEPTTRAAFCKVKRGIKGKPIVAVSDSWSVIRASLDFLSEDGSIMAELKSPIYKRIFNQIREGQIPVEYEAQVMWQWAAMRDHPPKHHYLFAWWEGETAGPLEIKPDWNYIDGALIPAAQEFWRRVEAREWPMPAGEKTLDGPSAQEAARRYLDALAMCEEADARKFEAKVALERLVGDAKRVIIPGLLRINQVLQKGRVSYSKIPALQEARKRGELDQYKSPDSLSPRIERL